MKVKFSKDDTLAIKGVALLFLLHHHCFCQYARFKNYEVNFFPFSSGSVVKVAAFFKICVGMFAFLSAYGLTVSLKKYSSDTCISGIQYRDYFKKRYIKLMWGFWFAFLISCAVCAVLKPTHFSLYFLKNDTNSGLHGAVYILLDFLGLACLTDTPTLNGTWWYMSLAIFIVMIIPFIAKITKKHGIFFTIMLFLFTPRLIATGNNFSIGESTNILRWAFSAFLGVVFAQNDLLVKMKSFMITSNKVLSKIIKFIAATICLVLLFNIYMRIGGTFADYCYEFRDCLIPVFVIYYFYDFIIDIPIIRHIFMFIGKHSMNVFFIHTFIRLYLFESFTYSFGYWFLIDLVLLLDSLAVSIIMEFMKKYLGYNKLLNKILSIMDSNTSRKVG